MKSYTYSEARGNFATVLEEAERDGAVEIRRETAQSFVSCPRQYPKGDPKRRVGCEGREVRSLHCRSGCDGARGTGAG